MRISKENKHFHHLGNKRSSQYQEKRSWITLCVISDWLYQWFVHIAKCATNESVMNSFYFQCVLQNRSLLCSCPWVRHARRLSLCDDPGSHFKEDCTFLFIRIRHLSKYFVFLFSENHLFVAYFASTCKVFFF